jgi:deazaflavin-dependent oxidoreductase (nitroreductase family)
VEFTAGVDPMANMYELESVASEKFIHLTTIGRKTGKHRMVKLWFGVKGAKVYLSHEGEDTDWMKNIKNNEQVTFEIGGKNFTGKARYLKDREDEARTAKVALYEKYYGKASKEVIEDWFSLSKLLLIDDVCPGT